MILVDGDKVSIVNNKPGPKPKKKAEAPAREFRHLKLYSGKVVTIHIGDRVKVGYAMPGTVHSFRKDGAVVVLDDSDVKSEFAGMSIVAVLARDMDILEVLP